MTFDEVLTGLEAMGDPALAAESARYHKSSRRMLGIRVPALTDLSKDIRAAVSLDARLSLADQLWQADIHETRVLAAKLLEQARIRPDDTGAWDMIQTWVPDFDGWAIADHVCIAGQKRLLADPARLDAVEGWTTSDHMWTRRAALVITLPWTKTRNAKPADLEIRNRVLGWAAGYVEDPEWFIQKAIAWWLRELSKHDAESVITYISGHGDKMKPFARKEALRHLD